MAHLLYVELSFYDKIIEIASKDMDLDFDEIKEEFGIEGDMEVDLSLYDDILAAYTKAFTKALDKEYMSKDKAEIDVLDKELKVTKNTFKLTDKSIQKTIKGTIENLLDNKDFIKKLSKVSGMDSSDIKDKLKELKDDASEMKIGSTINFNIYSRGITNKIVGFDVVVEKQKIISYYTNGDNVEATIEAGQKIKLTIDASKKVRKGKLTVDGEKVATADIRSLDEDKIDFDYVIYPERDEVKGTVYLTRKKAKKEVSGEYKFRIEGEQDGDDVYFEVKGTYSIKTSKELDGVSTKNTIKSDDLDEEELQEALEDAVKKDKTLNQIVEDIIKAEEEEKIKSRINYYGMIPVKSPEALELLSNKKATVLYIGYNYYSANDPYYMFENLRDVQDELDFYSYSIDSNSVTEEIKTALSDVEFVCSTTTATDDPEAKPECTEWPAIVLIKDGKPVKGFRGTVKYDDLKAALKEIGI